MRTGRRRARAPSWSQVDARLRSQILDAAVAGLLGHVDMDRVPAGRQCRVGVVAAEGDLYRVVAEAVQAVLGSVRPAARPYEEDRVAVVAQCRDDPVLGRPRANRADISSGRCASSSRSSMTGTSGSQPPAPQ